MNDELPDYAEVGQALEQANAGFSAAETHGICCGMLVIDQACDQNVWLAQVLEGNPHDEQFLKVRTLLRQLFVVTRLQMNDTGLGFELFLPTEVELEAQVEAMQDWCQGVSLGLSLAGMTDLKKLPADSREWVEDMVQIGTSGELGIDDEEESEAAFAEILEYLRVGVLMMNEEMQPIKAAPQVH